MLVLFYKQSNTDRLYKDISISTIMFEVIFQKKHIRFRLEGGNVVLMQCKIHVSTHETSTVKYSTSAC